MRKYVGQLHIGAVAATDPVAQTKSKEEDFFGNFDNAELKQQAVVEPTTRLVAVEKTPEKVENVNVDKLTVDLGKKATLKPAGKPKVGSAKKPGKKSAFGGVKPGLILYSRKLYKKFLIRKCHFDVCFILLAL